jgi:hypothetical protein
MAGNSRFPQVKECVNQGTQYHYILNTIKKQGTTCRTRAIWIGVERLIQDLIHGTANRLAHLGLLMSTLRCLTRSAWQKPLKLHDMLLNQVLRRAAMTLLCWRTR